jgi:hypothetical protein
MAKKPVSKEQFCVVTTEHRGVFGGYTSDADADPLVLKRARLCLFWSHDVKGFMGLAAGGPTSSCRIGPAVDEIRLRKITSVIACTPEAEKAWNGAPWSV